MSWKVWLMFIASTFFISATPGANMLLAFSFGVNHGIKKTLYALVGLSLGLLILLLISLSFLTYLAQNAPILFELFKLLAAAYLAYLGVKIWQQNQPALSPQTPIQSAQVSRLFLFKTGVWVSLSNPKAILFFASLFPKFLDTKEALLPQYLILTASFFVIETFWQLVYTVGGVALSKWLLKNARLMYLNRLCAVIFVFLAVGLAWDSITHWSI